VKESIATALAFNQRSLPMSDSTVPPPVMTQQHLDVFVALSKGYPLSNTDFDLLSELEFSIRRCVNGDSVVVPRKEVEWMQDYLIQLRDKHSITPITTVLHDITQKIERSWLTPDTSKESKV
jgi:hypothetical protein